MRYCRVHQRAWLPPGTTTRRTPTGYATVPTPGHWHPLPWVQVQYAVWLAQQGGCAGLITVQQAACDGCRE